jgi:hypothetical protein
MRNLRAVLGRLDNLPYSDAARMLGTTDSRLQRWLHDRESMPANREERIQEIAEVLVELEQVLARHAFGTWLRTSISALEGRTPLEEIRRSGSRRVIEVIRSYRDTSFT